MDGAIHRAAGPELLEECKKLNGCPTGEARITKGYKLPARYVIHAVGPVWHGGFRREDRLLANCYNNSLKLATEYNLKTIAFPAISTGVYRFPLERATRIAFKTVIEYLKKFDIPELVIFVCYSSHHLEVYTDIWKEFFGTDYDQ